MCIRDRAGADPCLGEALIGAADEVEHILPGGVFAVEHRQRVAALVAEDEALEQKVVGPAPGAAAARYQQLRLVEGFRVYERLVRALDNDPVLR